MHPAWVLCTLSCFPLGAPQDYQTHYFYWWLLTCPFAAVAALPVLPAGGTVALYAQLCRTMGISPFGTMRMQDHKQVLAMKSGEWFT